MDNNDSLDSSIHNDSGFISTSCSFTVCELDLEDSGHNDDTEVIFEDEVELPTLDEFISDVKNSVLTSTDPQEILQQRLNKIATQTKSLSLSTF